MSGWTASYRSIWDHPIFKGNALRVGAWQWMIHMAAWKPTRFKRDGKIEILERGELCVSQTQICEATGMTRQQLRTFLSELEKEGALQPRPNQKSTKSRKVYFITKYDTYQNSEKPPNQAATKQQPTKEQVNNSSVPTERASAKKTDSSVDPKKVMFDGGVELLGKAGVADRKARSIIGKWLKNHGVGDVIEAISAAKSQGVIEPVGWIEARWKTKPQKPADGSIPNHGIRLRKATPHPEAVRPREREPC